MEKLQAMFPNDTSVPSLRKYVVKAASEGEPLSAGDCEDIYNWRKSDGSLRGPKSITIVLSWDDWRETVKKQRERRIYEMNVQEGLKQGYSTFSADGTPNTKQGW